MDNEHKYDMHARICQQMNDIYRRKNETYHDSFGNTFKKYGPISALVRINDKFERFENLILGAKNQVPDEKITDTLIDMANYCIMTLIELEDKRRLDETIAHCSQTSGQSARAFASNLRPSSLGCTSTADIIDNRDQVSSFKPNPYTDKGNFGPRGV